MLLKINNKNFVYLFGLVAGIGIYYPFRNRIKPANKRLKRKAGSGTTMPPTRI